MNKDQAVELVSDKAAELLQAMSLDDLLGTVHPANRSGYSAADWLRLERAKRAVTLRLLKMHNYG